MTDTELFKQKFEQWREYLGGDSNGSVDSNSISGVLYTLYWEMGAYEAYVAICQSNPSSPLATLLFGNLTAFNYIQIQALRIRRLCEKPFFSKNKDVSVYSLRRIVDEMEQEQDAGRFTRSNVCKALNIPKTKAKVEAQFLADTPDMNGSFAIDSIIAGNIHTMLDCACTKKGKLRKKLTNELDKRLLVDKNVELKNIIEFVDKYTAHSASQNSRTQTNANDMQLRVADIKKVVNGLTEAFYICNMLINYSDTGLISIGWDGQIANLSKDEQELVSKTYKDIEAGVDELKGNAYKLLGVQ